MGDTDSKGYYRTLGVSSSASADEIRTAFRKLAKKFHPDRNPDPGSARIFQAVHEAYETLRDEHLRAQYDDFFCEPEHGVGEASHPKNPRKFSPGAALLFLGLLFAAPAALVAGVQFEPWLRAVTDSAVTSGPPTCRTPPVNGQVLENNTAWAWNANSMEIQNESARDAIVKIRGAASGKMLISFFVAGNAAARFDLIPDGTYRIQYAFGKSLDRDCTNFVNYFSAAELPNSEAFATRYEGIEIIHQILVYSIYPAPMDNFHPKIIDTGAFDAP